MVFQDGGGYVNPKGQFRVPIVFDNLIHKKEMPVTIGIFINPGAVPAGRRRQEAGRSNRSFEYDTLSDQYARFLEKEILPEVAKEYNLRKDAGRAGHLRHQLGRHLRLHRRLGAARPVQQGAEPRRQLHQHPRRRRLSRPDPQDARRSRSASSSRTAPNDLDNGTATGRWPTSRWRRR